MSLWSNGTTRFATDPGSVALAGGVPRSVVPDLPPPPVPNTTPTLVPLGTNVKNCCIEVNFTSPVGPWESIVMNYTGRVVPDVFDSSYRGFVDGVQVLFGTSPEYGTWTVRENLTEYASLFHGTTNFTFLFGVAIPSGSPGYFLSNLTLEFYPVPSGGTPPPEPNVILPLWFRQPIQSAGQTILANATVPSNTSSAELELFAYAFGPQEEFWWAYPHPARAVQFGVTGTTLGAVFPFPYVNTGGIDLFLWRPITGVFTTANVPYRLNLTGALGTIEGSHEYSANVSGVLSGSTWLLGGALLLWTNASYSGATPLATSYSGLASTTSGNVQSSSARASASSQLSTSAGPLTVTSWWNASFSGSVASSTSWSNVTDSTDLSGTTWTDNGAAVTSDQRDYSFQIAADQGGSFTETSNTGGGYPIYGNFTSELLNVYQSFDAERTDRLGTGVGGPVTSAESLVGQLAGAQGVVAGVEEIPTAGGAPLVVSTTLVSSSSTKEVTNAVGPPPASVVYSRLTVGVGTNPPGPYFAESILTDIARTTPIPLTGQVGLEPPGVEVGLTTTLVAELAGGLGPYAVAWTGLPAGCGAPIGLRVVCAPTTSGTYALRFIAADSQGDTLTAGPVYLFVGQALAGGVVPRNASVDIGQDAAFTVSIVGGEAPFECTWLVGGVSNGSGSVSCAAPFVTPAATSGVLVIGVQVTDAVGGNFTTPSVNLTVGATLRVALATSGRATVPVGSNATLVATVSGGVGPYTYAWTVDGALLQGYVGTRLDYVPLAAGVHVIQVAASDGPGTRAESQAINVTATNPSPTQSPTGVGGLSTGEWLVYLLVAVVVAQGVAIAWLLLRRPPSRVASRARAPGSPASRRPPTQGR